MKLLPLRGTRPVQKNWAKYAIKWDKSSRSNYQFKVKQFLKKYWKHHLVYEEFPVVGSRMTVDIFNATLRLAIEVQGEFHGGYSEWAHKGNPLNYKAQVERDLLKESWCEKNGIRYIEIFPDDIENLSKDFFESLGVSL